MTATGTYTTFESQVTLSALSVSPQSDGAWRDAGSGDLADYCVAGNTLTLRPVDASGNFLITLTK